MSNPWIKMRHDLDTDPAVILLCREADISTETAIGILWKLWTWADKHSIDGFLPGVTADWLAHHLRNDCAPCALAQAGWLRIEKDGLRIPNFDVHNSESAKKRAENAKRVEKTRNGGGQFTVTKKAHRKAAHGNTKSALEERRVDKRREEEKLSICADQESSFEQFWKLYPRRVGKRRAEVAWKKAIEQSPAEEILAAVAIFAKSPKARSEFVPHPTTFLNQGRWMDDPTDWLDGQPSPESRKPRHDPEVERSKIVFRVHNCAIHDHDSEGFCTNCGASRELVEQVENEINHDDGFEQAGDDRKAVSTLAGGEEANEEDATGGDS